MKNAQEVTYSGNGQVIKIVEGIGKERKYKKSKYIKREEEKARIREEKRKKRKRLAKIRKQNKSK